MRKITVVIVYFFIFTQVKSQITPIYKWAKSFGNSGSEVAISNAIDLHENTYTMGVFLDTIDADPGIGIFNLIAPTTSIFISKLDSSGNFKWAMSLNNITAPCDIEMDSIGCFFLTGSTSGTVDIDPSSVSVYNINDGAFIAKYDSLGNFLWAKQFSAVHTTHNISIDKNGNIIISGNFYGTVDFDPGPSIFNLTDNIMTAHGSYYICKLDPLGNFIWAKSISHNNSSNEKLTLGLDNLNNIYICASFAGTIDVDPGLAINNISLIGNYGCFICKLNPSGDFIWANQKSNISLHVDKSLAIDSYGNSYYTGAYMGSNQDIYFCKYDSNGNFLWEKTIGNYSTDRGQGIIVNKNSKLYITGIFAGTVDFDSGPSVFNMSSYNSYSDVFIVEYDSDGNFCKATSFGSSLADESCAIASNGNGSLYISGVFQNWASLSITPSIVLTSAGGDDVFTCKIIGFNSSSNVWPGDANSDGIADNLDVLELGLHYAQTGAPRATTSSLWQSYYAANWSGTITNGKNLNHSNCNGDGIINDDDTLAIYTNYSLTHAFKPEQTASNPQLTIIPDQANITAGNWGTASINLGNTIASISNINGIAYTVNYDNALFETDSVWLDYPTSFINASNQNLKFRKRNFTNGKLFTATTHTISGNVNGYGKIATLHYKIKSTLATDNVLNLSISQANQSNASGAITPLTAGSATLMAIGASVGINELTDGNYLTILPNPANESLTLALSKGEGIEPNAMVTIEITNAFGQVVLISTLKNNKEVLNITHLSNGVYFVKVLSINKQIGFKKIIVQR